MSINEKKINEYRDLRDAVLEKNLNPEQMARLDELSDIDLSDDVLEQAVAGLGSREALESWYTNNQGALRPQKAAKLNSDEGAQAVLYEDGQTEHIVTIKTGQR